MSSIWKMPPIKRKNDYTTENTHHINILRIIHKAMRYIAQNSD